MKQNAQDPIALQKEQQSHLQKQAEAQPKAAATNLNSEWLPSTTSNSSSTTASNGCLLPSST